MARGPGIRLALGTNSRRNRRVAWGWALSAIPIRNQFVPLAEAVPVRDTSSDAVSKSLVSPVSGTMFTNTFDADEAAPVHRTAARTNPSSSIPWKLSTINSTPASSLVICTRTLEG